MAKTAFLYSFSILGVVQFTSIHSTVLASETSAKFPKYASCTLELKQEDSFGQPKLDVLPRSCMHDFIPNQKELGLFSSLCKLAGNLTNAQYSFQEGKCPEEQAVAVCKAEEAPEFIGYYHGADARPEEFELFERDCSSNNGTLVPRTP